MTVGKRSQAAIAMANAVQQRGYKISPEQIERWTRQKTAPDLPRRYANGAPDRVIDYYCERSTLGRRGPKTKPLGIPTILGFRGYTDLIERGILLADMLELLQPRLIPDSANDDERADKIDHLRKRGELCSPLKSVPTKRLDGTENGDTLDRTLGMTFERVLDGESLDSTEEIIATLGKGKRVVGKEIELYKLVARYDNITLPDLQKQIKIHEDVIYLLETARAIYPHFVFEMQSNPYLAKFRFQREDFELGAVGFAFIFVVTPMPPFIAEGMKKSAALLSSEHPELQPYTPGLPLP